VPESPKNDPFDLVFKRSEMRKIIRILTLIAILVLAAVVWFNNVGDIRWRVLGARVRVRRELKKVMEVGKATPENIEKAKACRDMLHRIMRAKRAAEERKGFAGVTITWKDILPLLNMKEIPLCPAGGTYRINPSLQVPSCSIGSNGTVDLTDDHIILN